MQVIPCDLRSRVLHVSREHNGYVMLKSRTGLVECESYEYVVEVQQKMAALFLLEDSGASS